MVLPFFLTEIDVFPTLMASPNLAFSFVFDFVLRINVFATRRTAQPITILLMLVEYFESDFLGALSTALFLLGTILLMDL